MKKKQQQKSQANIPLQPSQIIKLMEKQEKTHKYDDLVLHSGGFMKIPIIKFTPEINQYLSKFEKQDRLSFLRCKLETLKGLEFKGENIHILTITYSSLNGDDLEIISKLFPNLKQLNLRHNNISRLEDLLYLKALKNLEILDISFNPIKNFKNYKEKLYEILPNIQNEDDQGFDDSMDNSSQDMWNSELDQNDDDSDDEYSIEDEEEYSDYEDECSDSSSPKKKKKNIKKNTNSRKKVKK